MFSKMRQLCKLIHFGARVITIRVVSTTKGKSYCVEGWVLKIGKIIAILGITKRHVGVT